MSNSIKILKAEPVGKLPCFCVSTDTGHYVTNDIKSHNSVLSQNIILHSLSHNDNIALALIDIKQTEYTNFKGMKGVVGVATSVRDSVEILRVAKLVMYKRNAEMAKLGIKSLTEYKPSKRSGKVFVTGRTYDENDVIDVKIDGEITQMRAADLVEYLHEGL